MKLYPLKILIPEKQVGFFEITTDDLAKICRIYVVSLIAYRDYLLKSESLLI